MRVWLLQRSEPTPHDNDGKQRLFRAGILANILSNNGHEVVWWTSTFDHYNRRQRATHHRRLHVSCKYSIQYLKSCGYKKNISFSRFFENIGIAKAFKKIAGKEKSAPDIIVASIPTAELAREAILFARPRGIPVVLDVRDLWPDFIVESVPSFFKPFVRIGLLPLIRKTQWVFRNADAIIGLTDDFVDWGLCYAGRKKSERDSVFPMAYIKRCLSDKENDEGRKFWESLKITGKDDLINVVFVGTLSRSFDLFEVLRAARSLEFQRAPVRFIICGTGEQYFTLQKMCASLDNVVMAGWVNDLQIRSLFKLAHIGLAPYVEISNYTKNLPNKPAEYFSGGLAVATSLSSGPLVKLIENYHCGFSYSNNANILVEKILGYIDKAAELSEARNNAIHVFDSLLDGDKVYTDMIRYLYNITQICNVSKNG